MAIAAAAICASYYALRGCDRVIGRVRAEIGRVNEMDQKVSHLLQIESTFSRWLDGQTVTLTVTTPGGK